jgi:signal transduction histidine kinase
MRIHLLLLSGLLFNLCLSAQVNIDSLYGVWNDVTKEDSNRFFAMQTIAWNGFIFSRPDTAYILAQELIDLAEIKKNEKWNAKGIYIQGVSFNVRGDFEKALEYFQKSASVSEKIDDYKGMANSIGSIGRINQDRGNFTEALLNYEESLKLYEKVDDKSNIAITLGNIGIVYYLQSNLSKTLEYYEKSIKIKEELGDKLGISRSLNNIGLVYIAQGNIPKTLEYYNKSLKISEEIGDKKLMANTYNNIGIIHHDQKNNSKALEYYLKSLKLREEIGNKSHIAASINNIANIYHDQDSLEKALEYHEKSLKIKEEIEDKFGISASLGNIGNIYLDQENFPKALELFEKKMQLCQEIGDQEGLADAYNSIGNVYFNQKKLNKAEVYSQKSLKLSKELGIAYLIQDAASGLSEIYEKQGEGLEALEMYKLKIQFRDSIHSEDTDFKLQQIEFTSQRLADSLGLVEKELKMEMDFQQKLHKKDKTRNIFIGLGLIAILLALGFWSRFRFIRKTNQALKVAKERAEQSEQYKQDFLANMSHEIRTPMHAISGMVKILKRNKHYPTQDTFLNAMHTSSENLVVILNDVLDLSKIEAGKLDIESIAMKPEAIIENVLQIMKFKAEEKGLILTATIEKEVPDLILGDPTRLNQILINLIGNSIKFTEKGNVTLLLTKVKDKLRFSISDTGIGIPKDRIDKIFGAFEQAKDSTSRNYGGTGLGLSITQQLTELQNGKIWVESEVGKGSSFFVELPLVEASSDAKDHSVITEERLKSMASSLKGAKILLVEDNAFNQMIAQDDLAHYIEDVKIDTVENGQLAVEKFQDNDYDLILMDVQMPIMNGFEATQKIREIEKASGKKKLMPIIAMTASLLKSEVDNCLAAGMNNYIPKPYQPEQLIGPIYEVLNTNNA